MQYIIIAVLLLWTGLATTVTGVPNQDLCSDLPQSCPPGEWPVCESDGSGHLVWKCVNFAGKSTSNGKSNSPGASVVQWAGEPNGGIPGFVGSGLTGIASSGFSSRGAYGSPSAGYAPNSSGFEASSSGFPGPFSSYASSGGFGSAPYGYASNSNPGFGAPSSGYGGNPAAMAQFAPSASGNGGPDGPPADSASPSGHNTPAASHAGHEAHGAGQQGPIPVPNSSSGFRPGAYGYGAYASSGNPSLGGSAPALALSQGQAASSPYGYASSGYAPAAQAASSPYGYVPSGFVPTPQSSSPYGYASSGYATAPQAAYRGYSQYESSSMLLEPSLKGKEGLKHIFKPFMPKASAPAAETGKPNATPGKSDAKKPSKPVASAGKRESAPLSPKKLDRSLVNTIDASKSKLKKKNKRQPSKKNEDRKDISRKNKVRKGISRKIK